MKEEWRAVEGYEGLYEISNLGRVKSLAKKWKLDNNRFFHKKEKILQWHININGYATVSLTNNYKSKWFTVHSLVWDHFGTNIRDGRKLQVDHIDNNKLNNIINNLQLLTNRENCSKEKFLRKKTSKYIGVYWCKRANKWRAQIYKNGKRTHIGYFQNEYDAHLAYKRTLNKTKKEMLA